jgi:hypothetical protein
MVLVAGAKVSQSMKSGAPIWYNLGAAPYARYTTASRACARTSWGLSQMPGMPARSFPRCGARARSRGHEPCRAPPVLDPRTRRPRNGRCKLHGGLSTGPRTAEGRARIAEAQRRRWRLTTVPPKGLPVPTPVQLTVSSAHEGSIGSGLRNCHPHSPIQVSHELNRD